MREAFVIGLDFGSTSVRALIVGVGDGREYGSAGCTYPGGSDGVYMVADEPHLARQNPLDYLKAMTVCVRNALAQAMRHDDFSAERIIGIGVDATASTPIPVDRRLRPLAASRKFSANLNAYAWMWKDHTAMTEAGRITEMAAQLHPEYLRKCGGSYSSEWFWAKLWHCLKVDPEVFSAAHIWLDFPDFIPVALGEIDDAALVRPGICAAGHKALYCKEWGGYPNSEFMGILAPELEELRRRMPDRVVDSAAVAGRLGRTWAAKLGLPAGIPIAAGLIDAHSGAVGAGVGAGRMVKIIGTSACDILAVPAKISLPDIIGICGQVDGSVLPGSCGLEAGQSAVGDIFNWFVTRICGGSHALFERLTAEAAAQPPGAHGLLALDWENGNRNILCDQELSGLLLGMTLHTSQSDIYRALVEATAFGARKILTHLNEAGVTVDEIICCGGVAEKNTLLMQCYADVLNRKLILSASSQTCALGAAIFGAVAANAYPDAETAQQRFCRFQEQVYLPDPAHVAVYNDLYALYSELHDSFGCSGIGFDHYRVMKKLLDIKRRNIRPA